MDSKIYPIVLCGGMGSRLWPMSRIEQPKQFQPVEGVGSPTYFQTTLQRHRGTIFGDPVVVTNARHGAIVDRQMRELQSGGIIIAEPAGRNTGPAVLAAALVLLERDADAQLLVLPSDHIIKGDINRIIGAMEEPADDGRIVTFGVEPHYPETGYGYIMDGGAYKNYAGLHRVSEFVEKPHFERAKQLLTTGFSYWASGISLFRADTIIEEYTRFDPDTVATVTEAVLRRSAKPVRAGGREHMLLDEASFIKATSEPTERAVFEHSSAIALAPLPGIEWDDVGAWTAVHQISNRTEDNNAISGDVIALDTKNSLIRSGDRLVTVIGMQDVIVVDTPDAVLVTSREKAQDVKKLVEMMQSSDRSQVRSHLTRDTTWGQVETLRRAAGYNLRHLSVNPGALVTIDGAGIGPSVVTVVHGEGECEFGGRKMRLKRGESLPISMEVALTINNTGSESLRLVQLMFDDKGEAAVDQVNVSAELHALPQTTRKGPETAAETKALEAALNAAR